MKKLLKQAFLMNLWLIALCGLAYPFAMTGAGKRHCNEGSIFLRR